MSSSWPVWERHSHVTSYIRHGDLNCSREELSLYVPGSLYSVCVYPAACICGVLLAVTSQSGSLDNLLQAASDLGQQFCVSVSHIQIFSFINERSLWLTIKSSLSFGFQNCRMQVHVNTKQDVSSLNGNYILLPVADRLSNVSPVLVPNWLVTSNICCVFVFKSPQMLLYLSHFPPPNSMQSSGHVTDGAVLASSLTLFRRKHTNNISHLHQSQCESVELDWTIIKILQLMWDLWLRELSITSWPLMPHNSNYPEQFNDKDGDNDPENQADPEKVSGVHIVNDWPHSDSPFQVSPSVSDN